MNTTLLNIIKSREDISDYLFHFTKNSDAKDTLLKITQSNSLKDIGGKGFLCFTEAPITLLLQMFEIFSKYYHPMYAPYGIAVKKEYFFKLGGRPVIYGSIDDKNEIALTSQWRYEEYEPNVKDFSWLREWRIKSPELELNPDNFFLIVNTKKEIQEIAFDIVDVDFDGCVADGGYWGFATGLIKRRFKCVSIEDLVELEKLSKEEVAKILATQNLDDNGEISLGSFTI